MNPFSLVKNDKPIKKEKNPLSINQVKALMELNGLDDRLTIARSMFYFQILSNGMRCSDVMFMRYGDFKNGRLSYKMMKTHSELKIATGIKTMLVLAEILGELNIYESYKTSTDHVFIINNLSLWDLSYGRYGTLACHIF